VTRARAVAALALLLLAAGCGSRTRNVTAPRVGGGAAMWVGTLSGGIVSDVVLDIQWDYRKQVTGDFVSGTGAPNHATVTGTISGSGDSLHLTIGTTALACRMIGDSLAGVLDPGGAPASLTARRVRRTSDPNVTSTLYPVTATGAVQAGALLWIATTEPAFARARDHALVDVVHVESPPGTAWASPALAWDGTRLWGEHAHGDGTSDLLGFDEHGRTADSIHVACRVTGLAYDGTYLWALRVDPPTLLKIAANGATLDSLHVEVPDVRCVAWYAGRLWVTGALLRRLYRLDAGGRVAVVCALPGNGVPQPVALTAFGTVFEYVEGVSGTTWVHELGIAPAIP